MKLPTEPQAPNLSPEAFKWLLMSQQGMGKSSFIASIPQVIILDPDGGCRALPGYVVDIRNWQDCLEVKRLLAREGAIEPYSWLGVDLLNLFYDYCSDYICKQLSIKHPSDSDHGKAWSRITQEFAHWIRDMGNLGLPMIATCHVNIIEVSIKGRKFNRYVPAFVGGGARSAYQRVLENFDIIGFLAFETKELEPVKDVRKAIDPDVATVNLPPSQQVETIESRVIHFQPSQYWEAEDTSRQLPPKLTLPSDWKEDWNCILSHWGKES